MEDPSWTRLWKWGEDDRTLDQFLATLPKHASCRSQLTKCTINHLDSDDAAIKDLAYMPRHKMRTTLTVCRSTRCCANPTESDCVASYKVNRYEECDLAGVYQEGDHIMGDNA
ncbi:MAG: hypothetical protein ACREOZ_00955, partial [Gloeomargaritales cyanobacterium]